MKRRSFPFGFTILITIIVVFVSISGALYQQKVYYEYLNRELIIKNDSLISVTIELSNALKTKVANKGTSFNHKSQYQK